MWGLHIWAWIKIAAYVCVHHLGFYIKRSDGSNGSIFIRPFQTGSSCGFKELITRLLQRAAVIEGLSLEWTEQFTL